MKRSISKPWRLVILLLVPLIFLWLISLREVRLKIGDYYYNHGKFEQATNWYGKIVRKEKIEVALDQSDCLKYEQDLAKFDSALVKQYNKDKP